MRYPILPFGVFCLFFAPVVLPVSAQFVDEVKVGVGTSLLGTGDVLVAKLEGEAIHQWNRILSGSVAVGIGYGDTQWYDPDEFSTLFSRDAIVHLDGNAFVSPFGNDKLYQLKLGTGPSVMYVRDESYRDYTGFIWRRESLEQRFSLGASMIVEQEVRLRQSYTAGLKAMFQAYLNGDVSPTLLVKMGKVL